MTKKSLALVIAASMGCGTFAQTSNATGSPTQYSVTNLPSLGGTNTEGNSINEFGLIAGYSNTSADQSTHAVAWLDGTRIDLKTLGGVNSNVAWPVKNDFGVISGISQTDKPDPLNEPWSCSAFFYGSNTGAGKTCLGFVWAFGEMRSLPPLSGGHNSFATGTNNRLQTAGWAETGVHDPNCDPTSGQVLQFLPVIWGPGKNQMQTLPLESGDDSGAATAINDRGDVAGISGTCDQAVGRYTATHMMVWRNGRPIDIGNIGGNAWNTPMAINEQDDVVGFANTLPGPGFSLHAFFWSHTGGAPTDLGVLYTGDTVSEALGINNRGQVVGLSCGSAGCHGFLWQDHVMTDINTLTPSYNGVIEDVQDINDLGQITGQAYDAASGTLVSFRATPVEHDGR
jgi:probable HAF family extracellular repeat protein